MQTICVLQLSSDSFFIILERLNYFRTRFCISGHCNGQSVERAPCSSAPCPKPSKSTESWSEWTLWNQCSVTCGKGSQARYRRCVSSQNTLGYSCGGNSMEVRQCDMGSCYTGTVGLWGKWTEWSRCSTSCGPGIQTRNRYCTKILKFFSRRCSDGNCFGSGVEQQFCNEKPCLSSSGQWSGWSSWGSCSVSCGSGVKRRTRHCQYGNCPGSHKDSAMCNQGSCGEWDATWGGKENLTSTTITPTVPETTLIPRPATTFTSTSLNASTVTTTEASDPVKSATTKEVTIRTFTSKETTTAEVKTSSTTSATTLAEPRSSANGTKPVPTLNNEFPSRKKTIRRFWLFDNGTLSRTHEIDPVLFETLKRQSELEMNNSGDLWREWGQIVCRVLNGHFRLGLLVDMLGDVRKWNPQTSPQVLWLGRLRRQRVRARSVPHTPMLTAMSVCRV
uniref:Uncharacterized protein n=1 Tax=Ascaris lumbricoides TaxID=6252 RepID=A0A9J2PGQ4_ASCLU